MSFFFLFCLFDFYLQVGQLIEKFLVQERDIEQVIMAARNGRCVKGFVCFGFCFLFVNLRGNFLLCLLDYE